MNFKNWLISEEIFPNKTATVYHRTKELGHIGNILSRGFESGHGSGCLYGCGLYTTFDLKSQFNDYMSRYGDYVIKFKVTNLENYLITPINVAKYILGKDYKISDQFKKHVINILVKDNIKKYGDKHDHISIASSTIETPGSKWMIQWMQDLQKYDQRQATEQYSSDFFKELYDEYGNNSIFNKFKGAIYYGRNDGYCLLKYEPVNDSTITMLGYAKASYHDLDKMNELLRNQGWETSTDKEKIKSIWQRPKSQRPPIELQDDKTKLKEYAQFNKLFKFKKLLDKSPTLDNRDFYEIMFASHGNPKILKMLMQHQKLNNRNVYQIISGGFENVKELAEILNTDNIELLDDEEIKYLLTNSNSRIELDNIIDIVLKYKQNINSNMTFNLLYHALDKKEVAEILGPRRIKKLDSWEVFELLKKPTEREDGHKDIAEILGREKINYLDSDHIKKLIKIKVLPIAEESGSMGQYAVWGQRKIYIYSKLEEMLEILGPENIKKLTKKDLEDILVPELSEDDKKRVKEALGEYGYNGE